MKEYKVVKHVHDELLNDLAREGWRVAHYQYAICAKQNSPFPEECHSVIMERDFVETSDGKAIIDD